MPKPITSTDWHLEGVSVEARKLAADYALLRKVKQGEVIDEMLLEVLPKKIREHFASVFDSDGPNPHGATDGA